MEKFLNKSKIWIASLLILCLAICFVPAMGKVFADDEGTKLSISDILTKDEFSGQEITSSLPFNPNFEGETEAERFNGWQTWAIQTTGRSAVVADLTSDMPIFENGKTYAEVGAVQGSYGMLFINTEKGVSAIETSSVINIPARSLYLLTFKVKLLDLKNNVGFFVNLVEVNSNISEDNLNKAQIKNIKSTVEKDSEGKDTTVYVSYAFLIQGSELYDTTARLQFSLGTRESDTDTSESKYETGLAALDDIRMFSLTSEQSSKLSTASNVTKANFSQISSNYNIKIANGAFNNTINQGYDLSSISLFTPADWTQSTSLNNEEAVYGIINTNSAMFSSKFPSLLNPGLTTYQTVGDISTTYNNVLMIYNKSNTHQTIKSSSISLSKEKIYELSFEFCTPAVKDTFAEETNSITFLVKDGDTIIYSRENIYSYDEADHQKDTATWKRLSLIIETGDVSKNLTFEIVFGTESESKTGAAYVDNVRLDARTADKAFNNIYENKLQLSSEETEYLEKGYVSLEDVKNLKSNDIVATYKYESTVVPTEPGKEENNSESTKDNTTNLTYLWYVIPSIILALCTIGGIVIFYVQKIKIKPKRKTKRLSNKKKSSYDRTKYSKPAKQEKIVENQKSVVKEPVVKEPVVKEKELTPEIEESNLSLEKQIEKLEQDYSENKISLKKYLSEREKLEDKIMKSTEE
ncbi:MAG: hypothetical protein MR024_02240 [Firmicutes bacterium]|nr:hypothetical protein [Bacillota bacterium]